MFRHPIESRRLNGDGAALRHRIPRVEGQIEQHQFELGSVGQRRPQTVLGCDLDADPGADGSRQQFGDYFCKLVDVDRLRREILLARERHQLPDELRATFGAVHRVAQVMLQALVLEPRAKQLKVAHDGHQEIVEFVGYATGESAHGLHLLGLAKRNLRPLALGHFGGQSLVRVGKLAGADLDAALERVGQMGQLVQIARGLVLPGPCAHARPHSALQGSRSERPFKYRGVSEATRSNPAADCEPSLR